MKQQVELQHFLYTKQFVELNMKTGSCISISWYQTIYK